MIENTIVPNRIVHKNWHLPTSMFVYEPSIETSRIVQTSYVLLPKFDARFVCFMCIFMAINVIQNNMDFQGV